MPTKDHYYKKFEDYNDVFADLVNVLLFDGQNIVQEDDLESGLVRSSYHVEGRLDEQERDAKKYWKKGGVRISVYGLENQTGEDPDFMCRVLPYDAAEYRDQVRTRNAIRRKNTEIRKSTPEGTKPHLLEVPDFYPAITLLLYFGDTHWKGSLHLRDHLKIPKGLDKYVSDYTTNLFEISFLEDWQVELFQSDFRFVAEYFVAERKKKAGLIPTFKHDLNNLKHVEEFMDLMNAITNSRRFSELPEFIKEKGDHAVLTSFFDEAEARGIAQGKFENLISQINRKQDLGQSDERIAEDLVENVSLVKTLSQLIRENKGAQPKDIYALYTKLTASEPK